MAFCQFPPISKCCFCQFPPNSKWHFCQFPPNLMKITIKNAPVECLILHFRRGVGGIISGRGKTASLFLHLHFRILLVVFVVDGLRAVDGFEIVAIFENIRTNPFNAIGNCDACKISAILEGSFSNLRDTLCNCDVGKT